jgi:hypothetical protein
MTVATKRMRRRRSFSLAVGLASCTLAICLAAGCASPRSNLGTSDSSCYLALPAAAKAVGSHSRLIGAHLFTLTDLRRQAPKLVAQIGAKGSPKQRVCVLAFSGQFRSTEVSKPHGQPVGQVAIVVLTNPSNSLLGTVILKKLPLRFSHSHIG